MGTRRERVILELDDDLSPGLARAAVAAKALDRDLNSLDGGLDRSGRTIDRFSGRLGLAVDAMLLLGPAAVAATAVAVPAVTTLASGVGAIGVAAAGTVVAFGGVGEALEALNEAHLEPTVENLEAAEEAMSRLAPAAQDFVEKMDSLRGLGGQIRDAGAEALFPGLVDALDALEIRGPDAIRIIEAVNSEVGDLARDGARSLASERWDDFFRMVERQAPRALDTMGRALGDVLHGVSELLEAFTGLSNDGLDWIADAADGFDRWATGLKGSKDFREFADYIRDVGPEIAETVGAVAGALVDIGQAAAPLSGPVLNAIEGIAEAVSAIAGSGFGDELMTAAVAMRIMSRVGPGVALATGALTSGRRGRGDGADGPGKGSAPRSPLKGLNTLPLVPLISATMEENDIGKFFGDLGARAGAATGADRFLPWLEREIKIQIGVEVDKEGAENSFSWVKAEIKRLNGETAKPKVDIDDKQARIKQRQADDWIFQWGNKDAAAEARIEDKQAQATSRRVDDWLNEWGSSVGTADVEARDHASGVISGVAGLLSALDGRVATTTIRTERINVTTDLYRRGYDTLGGLQRSASGGFVPKTGLPYADRHHYLLADGEGITTNRHGETDRFRDVIAGINQGLSRAQVKGMLADGGFVGRSSPNVSGGAPQVSLAGLTLRANVEGLGDVMFTIADEVVGSYRTHDARQAATVYSGVSDD